VATRALSEAVASAQMGCRGKYAGYVGADYIPSQTPAPLTGVEDIGTGLLVVNPQACAQACEEAPGCNAASFYGFLDEPDWPASKNCYIKTIATPCMAPADALDTKDLTMLLMKVGDDCAFHVQHL
jgi:hypothetical protein